jgi:hypothetical protein
MCSSLQPQLLRTCSSGIDYLKYDNCYDDGIKPEIRYPPMRDALNHTGHPIFFSMCEWGVDNPYIWAPAVGNSWRTTGDISDNWKSMMGNILQNDVGWESGQPGQVNSRQEHQSQEPRVVEMSYHGRTLIECVSIPFSCSVSFLVERSRYVGDWQRRHDQ